MVNKENIWDPFPQNMITLKGSFEPSWIKHKNIIWIL
jgi:hypothetical protein